MTEELVIMQDQQAVTTSLRVAEVFNKQHRNVLQSIKNLVDENSAVENTTAENSALLKTMFIEDSYTASNGKQNKMYYMNRDGFSLLVMGFTGKKALQFKLKYIDAFNKMEEYIKNENSPKIDVSDQVLKLAELNRIQSETNLNQMKMLDRLNSYQPKTSNTNTNRNYYNSDLIRIGDFAKIFSNRHGVSLSQVRLFKYLRKRHILIDKKYLGKKNKNPKYNTPEFKYSKKGYFEVIKTQKGSNIYQVTLLTLKGQEWLDQLVKSNLSKVLSPNI